MNACVRLVRRGLVGALLALISGGLTVAQAQEPATPNVEQELRAVRAVLNGAEMQEAFRYVDESKEETVREFLQVCNVAAPSQDEIYRARLLRKLLLIYGLENVFIDDETNVYGIRRGVGDGPTVILNTHFDNVRREPKEQAVEAFVADGRVWCTGSDDALVGAIQVLTVLRAMNAANIETEGDVWFAFFTGEEPWGNEASPGAEFFVQSNFPHNFDWRDGDVLVQLHGGGGGGVNMGGTDLRHRPQLRVFVPIDLSEWGPWNAVDVLVKIASRITDEVRDPRAWGAPAPERQGDVLVINPSQIQGSAALNGVASEAWMRLDMHTDTEARLWQAHEQIMQIAEEVCTEFGEGCSYHYTVNNKNGTEEGIEGYDLTDNAPVRYGAAAAEALYGEPGTVGSGGCGDCVRAIRNGMPSMSIRGSVIDRGGGNFEMGQGYRGPVVSRVRRRSSYHTITGSFPIEGLWAAIKHGLLFTVSYAGQAGQ